MRCSVQCIQSRSSPSNKCSFPSSRNPSLAKPRVNVCEPSKISGRANLITLSLRYDTTRVVENRQTTMSGVMSVRRRRKEGKPRFSGLNHKLRAPFTSQMRCIAFWVQSNDQNRLRSPGLIQLEGSLSSTFSEPASRKLLVASSYSSSAGRNVPRLPSIFTKVYFKRRKEDCVCLLDASVVIWESEAELDR